MGIVLAISALFFAFEWTTPLKKVDKTVIVQDVLAEEEIEITRRDPTPPPPPPPPDRKHPRSLKLWKRQWIPG